MSTAAQRAAWPLMLTAAAIFMLTMGARQSLGLFVQPIRDSGAVGIVSISFALAIGQFVWGAVQPIFGAIADEGGPLKVLVLGGLLLAAGLAATPWLDSDFGLMISLGVMTAAGAGAGAFSILIGATAARLPVEKRAFAAGFINAGGSFGQFLFAPIVQFLIGSFGWVAAMLAMAATSLLTIPLAFRLRMPKAEAGSVAKPPGEGLAAQLKLAARDRSYWLLHLGFFTCGVHIAFLVTHLPGEIRLCGLPAGVSATALALIGLFNIAGSLSAGALGTRWSMKWLLSAMYASRALMIGLYLVAPRTPLTFYVFAAALGFTFLATVPPTAGLIGKRFGPRYLGTLFGLAVLTHQIGGFFGAWLGGLTIARFGDYGWMWIADMLLALLAAAVTLPVREAPAAPPEPLPA